MCEVLAALDVLECMSGQDIRGNGSQLQCNKLWSYIQWKCMNEGKPIKFIQQAHAAASKALERATLTTWWDWPNGSRPFFWNWPQEVQNEVMVGLKWCLHEGFVPFRKNNESHEIR